VNFLYIYVNYLRILYDFHGFLMKARLSYKRHQVSPRKRKSEAGSLKANKGY